MDNAISNVLGLAPMPVEAEESKALVVVDPVDGPDIGIRDDFEYARGTIRDMIDKGKDALDNLINLADQSQQPRAYEAATALLNAIVEASDKLMINQKSRQDLEGKPSGGASPTGPQTTNIDKAIFVGSTAELASAIASMRK